MAVEIESRVCLGSAETIPKRHRTHFEKKRLYIVGGGEVSHDEEHHDICIDTPPETCAAPSFTFSLFPTNQLITKRQKEKKKENGRLAYNV